MSTTHFKRVWKDKFANSIPNLGKESTRTATQFPTGRLYIPFTKDGVSTGLP